jgi:phosphoglycolate phosphatase-like HAD superfamily hydrolase
VFQRGRSVKEHKVIFWDFDGVIKESVNVKTEAYVRLFEPFGRAVGERVREHHERHGGMSRFEKIPLYLSWAGQSEMQEEVSRYCDSFGTNVYRAVLECPWVPGVREYLANHYQRQIFILVSATPCGELRRILDALEIAGYFREVYGAPVSKTAAIASALARHQCLPTEALSIGDSMSDYEAAMANRIEFLLRRTPLNAEVQQDHKGRQCDDFKEWASESPL